MHSCLFTVQAYAELLQLKPTDGLCIGLHWLFFGPTQYLEVVDKGTSFSSLLYLFDLFLTLIFYNQI